MNVKKLFLLNLPYLLFVYPFDILTFVMCYELIQLVTEKNNLHDDVC